MFPHSSNPSGPRSSDPGRRLNADGQPARRIEARCRNRSDAANGNHRLRFPEKMSSRDYLRQHPAQHIGVASPGTSVCGSGPQASFIAAVGQGAAAAPCAGRVCNASLLPGKCMRTDQPLPANGTDRLRWDGGLDSFHTREGAKFGSKARCKYGNRQEIAWRRGCPPSRSPRKQKKTLWLLYSLA